MSAQNFACLLYRLFLLLHPADFRRRFGDEMLWIFDMSSREGQTAYMLYDGARSVFMQHARFDLQEEPADAFCLEVQTSGLTFARVGQATVLGGALLLALASVIAREMPPAPVFNQKTTCQQSDELEPQANLETRQ
jgi:hypothetical protein